MKRSGPITRTVGIRAVGTKARRDQKELAKVRPIVLQRGCEAREVLHHLCVGGLVAHHWRPRSHGGSNEPANLICLCAWAHDYVHAHPEWAQNHELLRW